MKPLLFTVIFTFLSTALTQTTTQTTTILTTTAIPSLTLTDSATSIIWNPKSTQSIAVEADEGFKIAFAITDCNIDGENNEYATIAAAENVDAFTFSYTVNSHPAYLYNTNKLFASFNGTSNSNFTANFTRVGERIISTTTEITTSTKFLPTPSTNDSNDMTVYLQGKSPEEYKNETVQNLFKEIVAEMATKYCRSQNFDLVDNITIENVNISGLISCPIWFACDSCVEITFSVPVYLNETSDFLWAGYQLTSNHLRIMWDRYSATYLNDGLTICTPPDEDSWIKWQIIIIIVVTVIFTILILAIRYISIKITKMARKRKLSDTASIISSVNGRTSQISLPPHYLQETPALFENAYPMYNPAKDLPFATPVFLESSEFPDYEVEESNENTRSIMGDQEESGA